MGRVIRILWHSMWLKCPACGHGKMFRSRWTMNVRCPVCDVIFERDGGEVTGGMAINSSVTCMLLFLGSAFAFFTTVPLWILFLALGVFGLTFTLAFYPHARGLWVGILYLGGSMFED